MLEFIEAMDRRSRVATVAIPTAKWKVTGGEMITIEARANRTRRLAIFFGESKFQEPKTLSQKEMYRRTS